MAEVLDARIEPLWMSKGKSCGLFGAHVTLTGMQNESPRLFWKVALAGIAACVLALGSARAQDMRTIEGQIFIRTKGGENIKLSLVDVLLFDEKVIAQNLEAKRKVAEPIYEALQPLVKAAEKKKEDASNAPNGENKLERSLAAIDAYYQILGKADYTHSALYYSSDLPAALQTTKTDADGKFSFKIPSGSYVLVANSRRSAGKETEFYNWMVKVTVDADKKVMLANDNLCSSGSADSVIRTPNGGESYIAEAMIGLSIANFMPLIEGRKREQANAEAAAAASNAASAAQRKAIELYPDLAVADSPLNKEFVSRVKSYRIEKKEFFAEPDWPLRLAKECSEALTAKPVPK